MKLAWDLTGRISSLGLLFTNLAALGAFCKKPGPESSQYVCVLSHLMTLHGIMTFVVLDLRIFSGSQKMDKSM